MEANKAAHDAALRAIRGGGSDALTSDAGAITLNVFPLIEGVLHSLQDAGLISADRNIPDLSGFEPSADRIAKLETLLGRDLPDDIGTITLVESERLGDVQTVVRWFDLETGVLLLLAVLFVALALWLSSRRIRMVLWLSVGAIGALLTARVLVRLTLEAVTRRQEEPGARVLVDAIVDAVARLADVVHLRPDGYRGRRGHRGLVLGGAGGQVPHVRRDAAPNAPPLGA